ncbi:MAG: class I SAM-dependent methyltransferase [Candidatus Korobacteraceae bacterium]
MAKWDDPEWLRIHLELEPYSVDKHCFNTDKEFAYRKGWEWTQCLYGLHRLGVITPTAKALGVGAGREPLLFYLADRISEVVGTDLYGNQAWAGSIGREADALILQDVQRFCPREFAAHRLRLMNMDGTDLQFQSNTFDFVWSLSSIEHFGCHEAAAKSVREMARVAKPGGVVVVATEFIPSKDTHPEYFNRSNFEEYVLHAARDLQPVEPMSYRAPSEVYIRDAIKVATDDVHRRRHHIVLDDGSIQWTSVIVFFRKV